MLKLLLYLSLLLLIQDELEVEEYWLDDKQSLSDKDSRSILSLSYQGSNDCVALCDDKVKDIRTTGMLALGIYWTVMAHLIIRKWLSGFLPSLLKPLQDLQGFPNSSPTGGRYVYCGIESHLSIKFITFVKLLTKFSADFNCKLHCPPQGKKFSRRNKRLILWTLCKTNGLEYGSTRTIMMDHLVQKQVHGIGWLNVQ